MRCLTAAALVCGVLLGGGWALWRAVDSARNVLVASREVDLGIVEISDIVRHRLVASVDDDSVVQVTSVRTTCGCLSAKAVNPSLCPIGTIAVDVELDARQRSGRQRFQVRAETSLGHVVWAISAVCAAAPFVVPCHIDVYVGPDAEKADLHCSVTALSRYGSPSASLVMDNGDVHEAVVSVERDDSSVIREYRVSCVLPLLASLAEARGRVSVRFSDSEHVLHAPVRIVRAKRLLVSPCPLLVAATSTEPVRLAFCATAGDVVLAVRLPSGRRLAVEAEAMCVEIPIEELVRGDSTTCLSFELSGGGQDKVPVFVFPP